MNKQDKLIVAILVIALMATFHFGSKDSKRRAEWERKQREVTMQQQQQQKLRQDAVFAAQNAASASTASEPASAVSAAGATAGGAGAGAAGAGAGAGQPRVAAKPALPEVTAALSNDVAVVTITSKGGGVKSVEMLHYDKTLDPEEGKVKLDFSASPAMAISGVPGIGAGDDFTVEAAPDGMSVVVSAAAANGAVFSRRISLGDGYAVSVSDTFNNPTDAAVSFGERKTGLSPMKLISKGATDMDMGVDVSVNAGGKITTQEIPKAAQGMFSKKGPSLADMFGATGGGCSQPSISSSAAVRASSRKPGEIRWAAVREKYFVQILTPAASAPAIEIIAARDASAPAGALVLESVAAAMVAPQESIAAGASLQNDFTLYVGPRKQSELRKLGAGYTDIMRFGVWSFFCRFLLDVLNFLYSLVPNYGVAIILMTVIVRLLLYPINKKNAEGMKRMKEVQPLIKEAQEKFKGDPKKLQQETMRIYGENKVNPLSSCLPMLFQLPIFIALFTVLRSSVELRYASFLWIADLSSPENLFAPQLAALGIPFGLNILPITMAATMALQTKLTPAAGDPAQQKMMMVMMPVMMLVMLYQFASALGLYWTVSQALAIFGLLRMRMKDKKKDSGFIPEPPRETRQMRREKERSGAK